MDGNDRHSKKKTEIVQSTEQNPNDLQHVRHGCRHKAYCVQ